MTIIKYHEWFRLMPDFRNTIYELCEDDFRKVKQITKEEAVRLIEENDLVKVHRDRFGTIWK